MTFSLFLAALVVAGVGGRLSRRWRVLGQGLIGLGCLLLIGIIVWQVRQNVFPPNSGPPNRYKMAVSYALANSMLRDTSGQDGKVVLLFPQRRLMDSDSKASYENGFIPPLRHDRGKLDLKAVRLEGANGDLSAFKATLDQDRDAMAVISFAGVPAGFETLFPAGPADSRFFYVFDAEGTTHWLAALKAGRIKAVVVPQPGAAPHSGERITGMPDTVFERFYLLATPENADEVAADLKADAGTKH